MHYRRHLGSVLSSPRYRIHQTFDPSRLYKPPSSLLGLAIPNLLFELSAEGLRLRFQKPDVAAHHAEMGNLLSLNPKIHRLRAHPKYTAASRTLRGSSSLVNEAFTSEIVFVFVIRASGKWGLFQLFEQFTAHAEEP